MKPDLIIIGCGARKLSHAARARDLYTGPLFVARRRYAEASGVPYLIASAKHRLIAPSRIVEPYDHQLSCSDRIARFHWAGLVQWQLRQIFFCEPRPAWVGTRKPIIEWHAGGTYLSPFEQAEARAVAHASLRPTFEVRTPLKGLGIGQQLGWYAQRRLAEAA